MSSDSAAGPVSTIGRLLRVLGLAFGLAVMVGATIGMGILRTPGEKLRSTDRISCGGVFALIQWRGIRIAMPCNWSPA